MPYRYNAITGELDLVADTTGFADSFVTDSGTATPVGGILNVLGDATQGSTTSGAGNTVTITNTNATELQIGVSALATDAVAIAGTDSVRVIVPTSLKAKLGVQTDEGIAYGQGDTNAIRWTSALLNGQIAIGNTAGSPAAATITAGTGITVTNGPNTITINSAGGGFAWTEITGTSQALVASNGYIANNVAVVTFTLPATCAIGDAIEIVGKGTGLYRIAQNAGQIIHYIASDTTSGVGGSLTAIEQYAGIEIVCITANTDWAVLDSVGNFTVV